MKNKLRVVYLCQFRNNHFTEILPLEFDILSKLTYYFKKKSRTISVSEGSVWNINAFKEFERFSDEIELHVISPYPFLAEKYYHFEENGINYHIFKNEDDRPDRLLFNRLTKYKFLSYSRNKRKICNIINEVKPDIIHLIGAENPSYAAAILDIPKDIPVLTQLQTLLNDPDFEKNYYMYKPWYNFRSEMEMKILKRSDFLGTIETSFNRILKDCLGIDKIVLNTTLALTEPININSFDKTYDFVYYARNIEKAADWAIEAFILASQKHPHITLDIVGGFTSDYKELLVKKLSNYGLKDNVIFEGEQITHDDVLNLVRKSRFAILPMKVDLVTGTIRECMANGIPVVTTITPASPQLNARRESVLLSEKGDFNGMAENMCKLLESHVFADFIKNNAIITSSERSSNFDIVTKYIAAYHAIIDYKRFDTPVPEYLISK